MEVRILVTGAAGFVGAHACRHFLSRDYRVLGVDNLFASTMDNIEDLLMRENFYFRNNDIRDANAMQDIYDNFLPTHVLHLAAIVSVPMCEEDPELARSVNQFAFDTLLKQANEAGVKQFIYASSSAVYGNAGNDPVTELTPANPIGLYGQTKLANEASAQALHSNEMSRIGLRFFNLFGSNDNPVSAYSAVIRLWVQALRAGKSPIIYGDGSATRDFCHIDNVLWALDCVMHSTLQGSDVFNIGTGVPTTLNALYQCLCRCLNVQIAPRYEPWRPADILHSCSNIEKAKAVLGYSPAVLLEEGLLAML